jgi:hypothetical protein|tara:strand:+ start:1765 stop:3195 length:1431 start_codon:yes stop_codon:yes gene_type:complete
MANNNVSFAGPAAGGIVTPAVQKAALSTNYLNFHSGGVNWAQQYLPELYEQEVERYGNRTVSSFLRMVGAEMPMASDQVIWSEQGRLHLAYNGSVNVTNGIITSITGIDSGATEAHAVRKGATVVGVVQGVVFKAFVTAGIEVATNTLTIKPYAGTNLDNLSGISGTNQSIKFFVYGSEFNKGTASMTDAVEPNFKSFTNKPMIIKDHYEVFGSDTAQIGWIEVSGESGQGGYLWYLKAEGDTRVRYEDYLEMSMIEAEKAVGSVSAGVPAGSEGLLSAIGSRGIVASNQFDASTTAPDKLAEFDLLLKELDKQGSIEENMLFLNRDANLYIDDLLAGLNAHITGGVDYGVFENSEDMALNLGFSGFRRGSYDFYKTDWKYLNDKSTRGLVGGLEGLLVPAGTSSVYDQQLGKNVRRPFLHVRYRASEADDRKMKSWITGSVGGASTTGDDKMEVHYLSERCLVVQAANNFIRFDS